MDYLKDTDWLITTWVHTDSDEEREIARRRITSLDDIGYFDALTRALTETKDEEERRTIYWMLETLLCRTGETQIGQFLMHQVATEPKKTVKMEILHHIGHAKGSGIRIQDASNAIECLSEKMRNLRAAAVDALGCCSDPGAEDALIKVIDDSLANPADSGWLTYDALWSLSEVATPKSILCAMNVIQKIDGLRFGTRKRDIKATAVKTLAKVAGSSQQELFCRLLNDRAWVVKWQAMRALSQHATSEEIPAITKRVRSILNSKRNIPQTEPPFLKPAAGITQFRLSEGADSETTELLWGLMALNRLSSLHDAKLLAAMRKNWSRLTTAEQTYLKSTIDQLDDLEVQQTESHPD